jgi:ribose transport system ATP-binding protein
VRNASKTFGNRMALKEFTLDLAPGEIHGLVGQNGSGKSTLIKVLTGYHTADPGAEITVAGEHHNLGGARSHDLIRVVHQDLGLNPAASVAENLCVGDYPRRRRLGRWAIDWAACAERTRKALAPFNPEIRPELPLGELDATDRAFVAIARATENLMGAGTGLLILDEPTAYLPLDGVQTLFDRLRRVADAGIAVLFVSHDLGEVLELTDRITVLRDGVIRFSGATRSTERSELVRHIVGRGIDLSAPTKQAKSHGSEALRLTDLKTREVRLPDFAIAGGEIVGFTGLLGSGFSRPLYAMFGADEHVESGQLTLKGSRLYLSELTPARAINAGLGMIPSDRPGLSLAQTLTTRENLTLLTLGKYLRKWGVIRGRAEEAATRDLLVSYGVQPPFANVSMSALSGGNQQKLILGKWVETQPDVMLLHEPTQGVDVGARQDIYARLRDVAASGTAVLIASANYEELPGICDRVLVFRRGEVVAELDGEFDHHTITTHCFAPVPTQ